MDRCVDVLLDTMPNRFALVGAAVGGVTAMALIRRAPERVSRLFLLSTNPYPPTAQQLERWGSWRVALSEGRTGRDLQRELLPVLLHTRTPDIDELVLSLADELGDAAFDHQLATQASRVDERPGLAQIEVPTLIIAGADDRICPVEKHQEMQALIPGARLSIVDGAGHLSMLEQPQQVAAALLSGLD